MRFAAVLILLPALHLAARAQPVSISGVVSDAETGLPLPSAHVFVSGSLMGTATDTQGRFILARIPRGAHRVVATMLGYAPQSVDTLMSGPDLVLDFRLEPRVIEAGRLEVTAERDESWRRNLERFEREFLGESESGTASRIVNPEMLDFDRNWWGRLRAKASAPLEIENRHLGYRVTYHLKDYDYTPSVLRYDGDPQFAELAPASPEEAARWVRNRVAAFNGSLRHFLLALLVDSTESQGFRLYRRPSLDNPSRSSLRFGLTPSDLLRDSDSTGAVLRFTGFVEIIYEPELEEQAFLKREGSFRRPAPQRSWIRLSSGPTLIDWLGSVVDPYGVTVYGYLAFERVGDELPKEYRPPGTVLNPSPDL